MITHKYVHHHHLQMMGERSRIWAPSSSSSSLSSTSNTFFSQRPLHFPFVGVCHSSRHYASIVASSSGVHTRQQQQMHQLLFRPTQQLHQLLIPNTNTLLTQKPPQQQRSQFAIRAKRGGKKGKGRKKVDPNLPLINEHLIAELFNKTKHDAITADTYEVRLIVDQGFVKEDDAESEGDDSDDDLDDADGNSSESSSKGGGGGGGQRATTTQVATLTEAIAISHEHSLDLMEVSIAQTPPVIKAVDFDKWQYEQKKIQKAALTKKKQEGSGAISDRSLKEFKFRAGIDFHDLERKTNNMIKYLTKGHAIRVTLTARQRTLKEDAAAIETTFERVKELVGDRAVEARGMRANDRKSYGTLLLHPNKASK